MPNFSHFFSFPKDNVKAVSLHRYCALEVKCDYLRETKACFVYSPPKGLRMQVLKTIQLQGIRPKSLFVKNKRIKKGIRLKQHETDRT